jgi:hypothetical protein
MTAKKLKAKPRRSSKRISKKPFRLISGGQTGVDRAALDAALKMKVPCRGWCPKGRKAEDGIIPSLYPLKETPSKSYEERTEWNVRDSDGTLILNTGVLEGGTKFTFEMAFKWMKPCLVINLKTKRHPTDIYEWLQTHRIKNLNVAGPRESKQPGIYKIASAFLSQFLAELFNHPV